MSFKKEASSFPMHNLVEIDQNFRRKIVTEIKTALRQEYENGSSPNKKIAKRTDTSTRAVKNWFSGRNAPDSSHLIRLMENSDAILASVLKLADRSYLVPYISYKNGNPKTEFLNGATAHGADIYSAGFCTINVTVALTTAGKLNQRQLWFLGILQQNRPVKAENIVSQWQVSPRTARTDVAGLIEIGMIQFSGARKTGHYTLVPSALGTVLGKAVR